MTTLAACFQSDNMSQTRIYIANISTSSTASNIVELLKEVGIECSYQDVFLPLVPLTVYLNPGYTYVELNEKEKAAKAILALQGRPSPTRFLEVGYAPADLAYLETADIHAGRIKAEREHQLDTNIRRLVKIRVTRAASNVRANLIWDEFVTMENGYPKIRCARIGQHGLCQHKKTHVPEEGLYFCGQHQHQRALLER